jgi:site-specific recombinase XerC
MPSLCPPTLTASEQRELLTATASHPRDHAIFSLALGTGLRLGEIVGLNVGDVYLPDRAPRTRIRLRREIAKRHRAGDAFLPEALIPKLERLWAFKLARSEDSSLDAPLFCAMSGRRISKRRVQILVRSWQIHAGFDRLYPFHALRHTAVTNVYRLSRDLFLAQRFARHANPMTTIIYTHASDEELSLRVRDLAC